MFGILCSVLRQLPLILVLSLEGQRSIDCFIQPDSVAMTGMHCGCSTGLDRRRQQVSQLMEDEDNFQNDLQEVTRIMENVNDLTRQEVSDVTPEKCEQLANQFQVGFRFD